MNQNNNNNFQKIQQQQNQNQEQDEEQKFSLFGSQNNNQNFKQQQQKYGNDNCTEKMYEKNFINLEQMPIEKLLEMADQSYEEMLYDKAQNLYELAYKKDSQSEIVLESFGQFLISIKNIDYAKQILEQAIVLYPEKNHKKFMEYAGICQGEVSIDSYKKGIEIIQQNVKNQIFFKEIKEMKKDLCQAFCAIAEIYQTDLLHLQDSEANCKSYLLKAYDLESKNLDVNFQFANFFINKNEIANAQPYFDFIISEIKKLEKKYMGNKFEVVKKKKKNTNKTSNQQQQEEVGEDENEDDSEQIQKELDKTNQNILTYEFKLTLVKVLIEIERYKDAAFVLKILLEEDQKDYEVQYMLSLCNYHLKKYKTAFQIMSQLKKKDLSYDPELQSAAIELDQCISQVYSSSSTQQQQSSQKTKNVNNTNQIQQQQMEEDEEDEWVDDDEDDEWEEENNLDGVVEEEDNDDEWEDDMEIEQ